MRDDSELVHLPVSVDTYHARVAEAAVAAGADMVNDVTGGLLDPAMLVTVAKLGVPYCLMHMRGDLANMTQVNMRLIKMERNACRIAYNRNRSNSISSCLLPAPQLCDGCCMCQQW
jgi:dihydropteroate synthase